MHAQTTLQAALLLQPPKAKNQGRRCNPWWQLLLPSAAERLCMQFRQAASAHQHNTPFCYCYAPLTTAWGMQQAASTKTHSMRPEQP
jgi:hypothetical protein